MPHYQARIWGWATLIYFLLEGDMIYDAHNQASYKLYVVDCGEGKHNNISFQAFFDFKSHGNRVTHSNTQ